MELIKQQDKELSVEFTDGELLMISKIYSEVFGKYRNPAKLSQVQVNAVIKYLNGKKQ